MPRTCATPYYRWTKRPAPGGALHRSASRSVCAKLVRQRKQAGQVRPALQSSNQTFMELGSRPLCGRLRLTLIDYCCPVVVTAELPVELAAIGGTHSYRPEGARSGRPRERPKTRTGRCDAAGRSKNGRRSSSTQLGDIPVVRVVERRQRQDLIR